jgi:hypothetical protein
MPKEWGVVELSGKIFEKNLRHFKKWNIYACYILVKG